MKKMKNIVALLLAMSMMLSVIATASFTDSEEISATEAVELLVALGVINGYDDGTFRPDGTVTRGQMAKMIYVIRTGYQSADNYKDDSTFPFTDTVGHWAEGYVNYCYGAGIIAGKSETKFDPDAQVTGIELAKMALIVLGYNANTAGLVGTTWETQTKLLAYSNDLYSDYNMSISLPATREYAAQLLANLVSSPTVTYRDGEYQTTNILGNENSSVMVKHMGVTEITGILTATDSDFEVEILADTKYTGTASSDYSYLLGNEVTAYTKKDKVYGMSATSNNEVVSFTMSDLDNMTSETITYDDTVYNVENAEITNALLTSSSDVSTLLGISNLNGASEITLVSNDGNDKTIEYILVTAKYYGKVTFVGTKTLTFSALDSNLNAKTSISRYDSDDEVAVSYYKNMAKDDYVVITMGENYLDGLTRIEETLTEEITVAGTKTGYVKAGNNWYETSLSLSFGTTYDAIIIDDVIYVAEEVDPSDDNTDYENFVMVQKVASALVTSSSSSLSSDKDYLNAIVMFSDGTLKAVKIDEVNGYEFGEGAVIGDVAVGSVFEYDTDDDKYQLTNADLETATSFNTDSNELLDENGKMLAYFADNAMVYVLYMDGTDVEAALVNGETVNSWAGNSSTDLLENVVSISYEASTIDGFDYVDFAVIVLSDNIPGEETQLAYAMVRDDSYLVKIDGDDYTAVEIFTGEKSVTIYVEGKVSYSENDFISYEENSTGIYDSEDITVLSAEKSAVLGISSGKIKVGFDNIDDTKIYTIDEDTVYIYIDEYEGMEGGKLITATEFESGKYYHNVIVFADSDDYANLIVVEINNAFEDESYYGSVRA